MSLLVAPPPIANGGLRLDERLGSYLYADVHRRWQEQHGRPHALCLHIDNRQRHCVDPARAAGLDLDTIAARQASETEGQLARAGIVVDGVCSVGSKGYVQFVNKFFRALLASEHVRVSRRSHFVDAQTGAPLSAALVTGHCRHCLAAVWGGVCHGCGMPSDSLELIGPQCIDDERSMVTRDFDVLSIDLQPFAPRLKEHFLGGARSLSPRLRTLLVRLLEGELPSLPLTTPGGGGCAVELAGLEGHVFEPWAELLPAHIYCSQQFDEASRWSGSCGPSLFFGFDSAFAYTLLHGAMLAATEQYALPQSYLSSQQYDVDGTESSWSPAATIGVDEVVAELGVDAFRFYMCSSSRMQQGASFSRSEARHVIRTLLTEPLRRVLAARTALPKSAAATWRRLPLDAVETETSRHYAVQNLDLRAIVRRLGRLLVTLAVEAESAARAGDGGAVRTIGAGLALWAQLALPVVPTLAGRIKDALLGPEQHQRYLSYAALFQATRQPPLDYDHVAQGVCA